jgi:hypothetical protein
METGFSQIRIGRAQRRKPSIVIRDDPHNQETPDPTLF